MTPHPDPEYEDRRHSRASSIVPVVFLLLVLIPVLYYGMDSERARWKQARANLVYQDGNPDEAIEMMDQAARLAPRDEDLKLNLAQMLMRNGQSERALEIVDEVLADAADPVAALRTRAESLMYLDRSEEALETVKSIADQLSPEDVNDAARFNELAYFRALAGTELRTAQLDIDRAVESTSSSLRWMGAYPMKLEDQTLIAAALVSRHVDRQLEVMDLLNRRIEDFELILTVTQQKINEIIYGLMLEAFPFVDQQETYVQNLQTEVRLQEQSLAFLYSVRALLFQDLGQKENSDRDRYATQKLDFNAEQLIESVPDDWQLLSLLLQGAQLLDTRAMVSSASGFPDQALPDLDLAVLATSLLKYTFSGQIQNTIRDESGTMFQPETTRRVEAVIRKHRSDVLHRLGKTRQSQKDLDRIRELGFDRNEKLF